jgi:threonylcarbamoyladenosine tRNA methylthiotransferase MtaB
LDRVYIKTLGCKVNSFDSHALENQFKASKCLLVDTPELADIAVVNTCSVTANADKEARYLARRFRREAPSSLVVMTGCYAQTDSQRLSEMPDIDVVVPNDAKTDLVPFVLAQLDAKRRGDHFLKLPSSSKLISENKQSHFKSSIMLFDKADSTQTRAFVKIQDGCNGFCSYCLIPYARGASRSVESDAALAEIKRLVASGTREIVLTGIHIGDFGVERLTESEIERKVDPFVEFMKRVFDISGLERVRISSLEPAELTENLIKVLYENRAKFCDHFHLPLQSGNDTILKLMRRKYDTKRYFESCEMARSYFPNVCLGADVIPGFPSETEEQSAETLDFIRRAGLHYLHVFPYSKRPNTSAAKMPAHLDPMVVKARAQKLRQVSKELRLNYLRRFVGSDVEVLWEKDTDAQDRRIGITRNYINVVSADSDEINPSGSLTTVKLKGFVGEERLLGRHDTHHTYLV